MQGNSFSQSANMQSQAILHESLNYGASLTITAFAFKTDSNNVYTALHCITVLTLCESVSTFNLFWAHLTLMM